MASAIDGVLARCARRAAGRCPRRRLRTGAVMSLRPEVRALVGQLLQPRRSDHETALRLIEQAEGRLEAGKLLRGAEQHLTAHDAFYSTIRDALRAVMEEFGLQLAGKKGE